MTSTSRSHSVPGVRLRCIVCARRPSALPTKVQPQCALKGNRGHEQRHEPRALQHPVDKQPQHGNQDHEIRGAQRTTGRHPHNVGLRRSRWSIRAPADSSRCQRASGSSRPTLAGTTGGRRAWTVSEICAADARQGQPHERPLITQNSGPTGIRSRARSHGSNGSKPQSSMPTSRRRPPLPRRTSSDPRRRSRWSSFRSSALAA